MTIGGLRYRIRRKVKVKLEKIDIIAENKTTDIHLDFVVWNTIFDKQIEVENILWMIFPRRFFGVPRR